MWDGAQVSLWVVQPPPPPPRHGLVQQRPAGRERSKATTAAGTAVTVLAAKSGPGGSLRTLGWCLF